MLFFRLFGQAELRSDDGSQLSSVLAQPKRLALLTYLAAARPTGFHRRDTLLGLFWPDTDQERGRAALRQSLYTLRQTLGSDVIITRGDGEVALNPERITCDVVQFRQRVANDPAGAAELYTGDLLNGFFIADAPEFERWLEEERWLLRREAAAAAWSVAETQQEKDADAAASWAMRAASLDPFNEEAVRRLMQLLAQGGHRASALQVYQNFARVLARELDTAPSDETTHLAESLRLLPAKTGNGNGNGLAHLEIGALPKLRRTRLLIPAAAAIVVAVGLGLYTMVVARTAPETIAVGAIAGDPALRDMLSTSLARVEGLAVISNTRVLELSRGDTTAAAIVAAARRAGARKLLEGSVYKDAAGGLRLSLQWLSLSDGRARSAIEVTEHNVFGLVDAATAAIARTLGATPPAARFAAVTTKSLKAYRLFEEGLRSYYREERVGAERLWQEAVREDSTFAIALWYLSRIHDLDFNYTRRALHHAQHSSDRERLFITASFLSQMDDPRTTAVAETLSIRYPAEPDGHYLLGYAKMWAGDPLGAIPHFRHVVRMDTASLFDKYALRCRACDALNEISTAYSMADSSSALERHARAWLKVQPESRAAWSAMIGAHEIHGRYEEAIQAREKLVSIPPANYADINITETFMRAGDFIAAEEMLLDRIRNGDRDTRANAYFKHTLSLRSQKRYQEALHAAREFYRLNDDPTPIYSRLPEAYALLALKRYREAAILFDSIAYKRFTPLSPARNARAFVGGLARSAEAYAMLGDTGRVKQIADTMKKYAAYTAFAPARDAHHAAQAFVLRARGDHDGAAREFRFALVQPGTVSTRVHYNLAGELMAIGKYREAALVLGSAIRSSVGGSGYAMTHAELHARAAEAWHKAGVVDSARVHQRWLAETRVPGNTNLLALTAPSN